jgi:long-chain acyl-CoA synthetase
MAELKYTPQKKAFNFPGNLGRLLDISAEVCPDRMGIGVPGLVLTFKEYHDRVCRMVHGLKKIGVERNDRVLLISPNSMDYALISLALFRMGAVLVPLNPRIKHFELAHIISETRPKHIICRPDNLSTAQKSYELTGDLPSPFFITVDEKAPYTMFIEDLDFSEATTRCEDMDANDTAMIIYTAAMEGYALGAELTHASLFYNAAFFAEEAFRTKDPGSEVLSCILPLFHCYGFTTGFLVPLAGCATCFILDTSLRGRQIVNIMETYHVTQIISVPAIYYSLVNHLSGKPELCSRLHNLTSGGIGITVELLEKYRDTLNLNISEGYGLTECSPVITWNGLSRSPKFGTVGYPLGCCEVKIVDDEGQEVPKGKEGEVLTRGLNVFSSYLNQPEHTKKAFMDNWFRTGDLGYLDNEDYLTLTGLKKDMINIFGLKAYPKEVERILTYYPHIDSVRVWGEWHPRHRDIVACEVFLKSGSTITEKDLLNWCRDNISPYKIPRQIVIHP